MEPMKSHANEQPRTNLSSLEWLTNQAVAKHKAKQSQEAIALYLEVISLKPQQPAWLYGNAITLLALEKNFEVGIELGEQALIIHPEDEEVCRALGILYEQQQDVLNCIDQYQKAIALEPIQPDWLYCNLAKQLLRNQEIAEAVKIAYLGTQYYPNFYPLQYTLAQALMVEEKWDQAIAAYRRVQELNPNWAEIDSQLNQAIYRRSQKETQQEFKLDQSLNHKSGSSEEYLASGDKFFALQMWKEAEIAYRKASDLDSNRVWSFYNLGRVLTKQNKITQAIEAYYQAIEVAPNFPNVYPTLGDLLYEQRRWQEAKKAYLKAVKLNPNFAWYQYNLGRTLLELHEIEDAIDAYLRTIEIDPDFMLAYPTLMELLVKQKLWEQLLSVGQQSLFKNPDWQQAYFYLGKAQNQLGKYDEAIATYNLASEIFSTSYEVYEGLGDAYLAKSHSENWNSQLSMSYKTKAIENYHQVIAFKADHTAVYHKLLSIEPRNVDLYARLAKVLETQEQLDGAMQFYQIARTICPENLAFSLQLYRAIEQKNKSLAEKISASEVIDLEKLQRELILRCDLQPLVSIIVPVYNKIGYTLNCLKSIQDNVSMAIPIEVLVVDDGSSDETRAILERILGLRYVKNPYNMGFINSCNNGASQSQGKYLCFLNNDTEVCPNWLESLVATIESNAQIGVVGSKLVYPNGILQEAGGIIWSNAAGWNYGRMGNPQAPEFNYLRETDYCSGASLLVKKATFDSLNGFEREFAPAYYEDTDLCFGVRNQLGLKVVYQPKSQIIHYEGISSGTSTTSGVKKYQAINAVKFATKWQSVLTNHCQPGNPLNPLIAPRRFNGQKVVLMVEHDLPFYDKESGYRRIFEILKILKAINCHIIYAPDRGNPEEPYISQLQNMGIEVLYRHQKYQVSIAEQIKQVLPIVDIAWICRPDLNQKYAWLVRHDNPQAKIIYDTVDLHYVRLKRAWELLDDTSETKSSLEAEWRGMQKHELHMAQQADLTLTVTPVEKKALQQQGIRQVEVIPNIHEPYLGERQSFAERQGILFIGGYKHVPNIDCVEWLCQEIMPIVWQSLPDLQVTLLGSHPTEAVKQLANERVTVTGYIQDVTPYFLSHRVFVSPLRFGAGMKGKIGQSLEYGLPVVSTMVGAEGMGLTDEYDVLIADDKQHFAEQIIRLHEDEKLWNCLADNSKAAIIPYTSGYIQSKLEKLIE
jgi:tetratricopeptide (TPR) repeat protein